MAATYSRRSGSSISGTRSAHEPGGPAARASPSLLADPGVNHRGDVTSPGERPGADRPGQHVPGVQAGRLGAAQRAEQPGNASGQFRVLPVLGQLLAQQALYTGQ